MVMEKHLRSFVKLKRVQRCMEDEMRKITFADVMTDIQNELKNE